LSPKCPQCGFTNFASATECKKCQAPLAPASYADNIWRDGKYLMMDLRGCLLPDRCWKCNSDFKVSKWTLEINFYPLMSYFLVMMGAVVWTTYSVPAVLCREHRNIALDGPKNTLFPNLLIIGGILSLIMTVISGFALMLLVTTVVLLGVGLVLFKMVQPVFKVKARSKPYIWIKGVDQQYLSQLPRRK
jgi:hypothetical protein